MAHRRQWGTISQRGGLDRNHRGAWQLQWTEAGRRKSKTVRDMTRREAEAELARIRASVGESPDATPTVSQVLDEFVRPKWDTQRYNTRKNKESAWRAHVEPTWGDVMVSDVRRGAVQSWLDGMSRASGRTSLVVLREIMREALVREWVEADPTEGVVMSGKGARQTRMVWTADELDRIERAARGTDVEPAVVLMIHTGMRPGEARAVMPGDVTWGIVGGMRVLTVRVDKTAAASRKQEESQGVVGKTKTEAGTRTAVMVGGEERLIELCDEARARGDRFLSDDGLGRPLTQSALNYEWRGICERAGVEFAPVRNIRPSFVTHMHDDLGVPLDAIQGQVGHSSVEVTSQVYDRPSDAQRAATFAGAVEEAAQKSREIAANRSGDERAAL
jgi:integrase